MQATGSQHRGVVVARNGMVAASQPLAVSAGIRALQQGGSFADAAIAVSAVLCVVEPYASHLGGDAFAIVYDAADGSVAALNGSGAAPKAASTAHFSGGIPLRGIAAASVPGLVDTWQTLHLRWGHLPLSEILRTAIDYAADGHPVGFQASRRFAAGEPLLRAFPETAAALAPSGLPVPGETIRQPDLAWTLERVAESGSDAFYRGDVTDRILAYSREAGGLFAPEDFAEHATEVSAPISVDYRGFRVHGQPPVSQGHILLQMLNLIERDDVGASGHNTAQTIHLQVEAKKLAFADRAAYLGDPKFVSVPLDRLLSKEYARRRRDLIDPKQAATAVSAGEIDHDTTYFCIVDSDGSAVSFIQSVFWGFGSGAVAPGTGVLFNNRMTGFSLDPASPNVIAPGKRTAHTLNAYMITRPGRNSKPGSGSEARSALAWVGGTPGGDVQVQSNLQVITNVIDFGLNPQQAVEAPRWQHGGGVGAADEPASGVLAIEDRVSEAARGELAARGHRVESLGPWGHGSAYQLIAVDERTGALMGASDPRVDGHAAGF